ncbi:unnamed protein product [Ambrosiozyma monospora]|uniref:Glucosidase 2 subunit beta n=1 Tax=Ambrosiozyma monospora TaxID=43982 RepID=A0A9W6YVY8_AMBMO|nr:unnamed protein product [Ambrosiozyma monospora]
MQLSRTSNNLNRKSWSLVFLQTLLVLTQTVQASDDQQQQQQLQAQNPLQQQGEIKGVSPEDQHLYQPNSKGLFQCLSNPEIQIPLWKLNDDYCDCPDGSDEPGTSACGPLSRFYCANIGGPKLSNGQSGGYLPGFKVNDGVCDYDVCCDGSDELPGVCENKCDELKKQNDLLINEKVSVLKKGLASKVKTLNKGKDARFRLVAERDKLAENLKELETQLTQLESQQNENHDFVNGLFGKLDSKLAEVDGVVGKVVQREKKLDDSLSLLDKVLAGLSNDYNPNFNDPAVKAAVQAYRDFEANKGDDFISNDSENRKVGEGFSDLYKEIESLKKQVIQLSKSSESSAAAPSSTGFSLQGFMESLVSSFLGIDPPKKQNTDGGNDKGFEVADGDLDKTIKDIKNKIKSFTRELDNKNKDLEKNYGPDDILRGLEGECIVEPINGYDYKICFTDKLEQINKGGRGTLIGKFDNSELNDGVLKMHYNRGEKCWNGPIRKGSVTFQCGTKNKILAVSEPEKCEYSFVVSSPIGCFQEELDKLQNDY